MRPSPRPAPGRTSACDTWSRSRWRSTPARGILLSVYLAIGATSALLLVRREPALVAPLLFVEVVYELTTPLSVGTLEHPVVLSNLGIAAFHALTLVAYLRGSLAPTGRAEAREATP